MKKLVIFFISVLQTLSLGRDNPHIQRPLSPNTAVKRSPFPLQRNAPVKSGWLVVKRKAYLHKSGGSHWKNALRQINAKSVTPVFHHLLGKSTPLSLIVHISLPEGQNVFDAAEILMEDPAVEWAEPIYRHRLAYYPDDAMISMQWHIEKMQCPAAWDLFQGDTSVVIGIIDTGLELDHPDLQAHIWKNPGEIPGNGLDDDANGFADDASGWDFGNNDGDPSPSSVLSNDRQFHGTAIAGAAAGITNNGIGIASPAFNARIMAVKTSEDEDEEQYVNAAYLGIEYAAANGADVINCSFGSPYPSNADREIINDALEQGVVIVAAAGNESRSGSEYPGAYAGVLSVAGTDEADKLLSFSNYGPGVKLCAPGEFIYTTYGNHGYSALEGTSLSTPLVAGVAALVRGFHPEWNSDQVREQVRVSALPIDPLNPGYEGQLGWGRVDAYRALTVTSPSIGVINTLIEEAWEGSDHNGKFAPGETLEILFTIQNFLAPSDAVLLTFSTEHPDIQIENPQVMLAPLDSMETASNTEPVRVLIRDQAESGQDIPVDILIQSGAFEDLYSFFIEIDYDYGNIEAKNVKATLTSNGRLGYADYGDQKKGTGFVFHGDDNLLFEGALMAATGPDSVSDAARGADIDAANADFQALDDGILSIISPGQKADSEGRSGFSDVNAWNSLGLRIRQTAYAFNSDPDGNYILISYELTSESRHPALYFGLFMDWDVGDNGINSGTNQPGFDSLLNLAYVFDPALEVYGGVEVLSESHPVLYRSVHNAGEIYDGYEDSEKWTHLSGGIQTIDKTDPDDYSHVIGAGPLSIFFGDTVIVGFAILAGDGLDELRQSAQAARQKWRALALEDTTPVPNVNPDTSFVLYPGTPNPFTQETVIRFTFPKDGTPILSILDVLGREVMVIEELIDLKKNDDAGLVTQYAIWNGQTSRGSRAASGLYFARLKYQSYQKIQKLILLSGE